MSTNPYANVEMTDEMLDRIFGPDDMIPLPNSEGTQLFHDTLQYIPPYLVTGSLHILEHRYELEGVKYRCLWAYSDPSNDPFEVSTITPRPRKVSVEPPAVPL